MSHIHTTGTSQRRGVTVFTPGGGAFRATASGTPNPHSPAVEQAGLGRGFSLARPVSSGDFASAVAAPAAVVLPAPGPGLGHAVHAVSFGYSATPVNGQLTVTDGVTTYRLPVAAAGPNLHRFSPPMAFAPDRAVSGSLAGGGAGVSGYFGFAGRSLV